MGGSLVLQGGDRRSTKLDTGSSRPERATGTRSAAVTAGGAGGALFLVQEILRATGTAATFTQ